jgi:hypothetical protein
MKIIIEEIKYETLIHLVIFIDFIVCYYFYFVILGSNTTRVNVMRVISHIIMIRKFFNVTEIANQGL